LKTIGDNCLLKWTTSGEQTERLIKEEQLECRQKLDNTSGGSCFLFRCLTKGSLSECAASMLLQQ